MTKKEKTDFNSRLEKNQKIYDFLLNKADIIEYMNKVDKKIGERPPSNEAMIKYTKKLSGQLNTLIKELKKD